MYTDIIYKKFEKISIPWNDIKFKNFFEFLTSILKG